MNESLSDAIATYNAAVTEYHAKALALGEAIEAVSAEVDAINAQIAEWRGA